MPFLNPSHRPIINHPSGHAVEVIVSYKTSGEFIPLYFRVTDDNEERFTYQISSIKAIKDNYMVKTFYCTYDVKGYRNDIVLCFDEEKSIWVIG